MNLKLVIGLSFFGLVMGFATTYFMSSTAETFCWLPIFICSAWLIARHTKTKHFLHGFLTGVLNYIWVIVVHIILKDVYLAQHAKEAGQYAMMIKEGIDIISGIVLTGSLFAIFYGVVLGSFASIASKLRGGTVKIRTK